MNNLTPRAQQILAWAGTEAERLKYRWVTPELMLLGMIQLGQGVAFAVLKKAGVTMPAVSAQLIRIGDAPDTVTGDATVAKVLPYSTRANNVLEFAGWEAEALGHSYLGTEHLLLGILREAEMSGVGGILQALAVDPDAIRNDIFLELDPTYSGSEPAVSKVMESTRFSPLAMKAITQAHKEALRYGHTFVGTEHLLLGITRLETGTALDVLSKLAVNLEVLRDEIAKHGCSDCHGAPGSPEAVTYTSRFGKVIKHAEKEARTLQHAYLGTEHLLLGLLRDKDSFAARTLNRLGVDYHLAVREILHSIDAEDITAPLQATPAAASSSAATSLVPCNVKLRPEILDAAKKLGMILDEYIDHLHTLHYGKGDATA